jgi:hypothetical protein
MLVTVGDHTEAVVPAVAKTFVEAFKDGDSQPSGWIVGYHYSPGHRRTIANWGSPEKVDTVNLLPGRLSASARS